MAETQKILGQAAPAAGVLADCYTAPNRAVCSSVIACNRDGANDTLIRISVAVNAAADSAKQYLYYDLPLFAADTFIATIGWTLGISDVIRVYTDIATASFNLFGVEIT